ncbi:MAG: spore cortex-lytic protein [Lachnospiraceae bacterium]|nr:spore cortex-lytic protein [Lachnospiraceae bacterium]
MQSQTAKSGRPPFSTQQGNRSRNPARTSRKPKPILYRLRRFCKRINWARIGALLLILLVLSLAIYGAVSLCRNVRYQNVQPEAPEPEGTLSEPEPTGYIFKYGEGYAVDMEHLTDAWAAEAGFEKRYTLTDDERLEIAQVLTAEADGEPFAGKVAVAQCILQTCEDTEMRPHEVLSMYSYSKRRPTPTAEALEAVAAVFDFGHMATSEPIKYFYAPALTDSEWHESQIYVMTINGHKFFKEANNDAGGRGN